jgi:hypothetical protein
MIENIYNEDDGIIVFTWEKESPLRQGTGVRVYIRKYGNIDDNDGVAASIVYWCDEKLYYCHIYHNTDNFAKDANYAESFKLLKDAKKYIDNILDADGVITIDSKLKVLI